MDSNADLAGGHASAPRRDCLRLIAYAAIGLPLMLRVGASFATYDIPAFYLRAEDARLMLLQFLLIGVAFLPVTRRALARVCAQPLALSWPMVLGLALLVLVGCYVGHYLVLCGYDLSRDEQMAVFDTRIYAAHRLVWPLPAAWRGDADALNTLTTLAVAHPVAWVSNYLPGNSMLRAAVGSVVDPALTGPLLTAGSALTLWGCARRLWPNDRETASISLLLLMCSGAVVMAGMSAFAMPAHLFFNLVWLWLFLADRRRTDVAAIAVGFIGTGLHQPLFHPLFVAPFMAKLVWERRWGRLALFVPAYGAIGLFWMWYPHYTQGLVAGPGSVTQMGVSFAERLAQMHTQNTNYLPMTAENLLRFCNWSSLAMLPLLIAGFCAVRRDTMALALAAGFVAPIVIMAIILPHQGHGFGYRYVHGVLGSAALLGGYGWRWLGTAQTRLRPVLVAALALSALVLLPVQAWMTHRLYAPYAETNARINTADADYVMIAEGDAPYTLDLVLNRPDLSNRPIRLAAGEIDDITELAHRICHAQKPVTIALPTDAFFGTISDYFNALPMGQANARLAEQTAEFQDAGCRVKILR